MAAVPVAPPLDGALIPAPSSDSTALVVSSGSSSNALTVASASLPGVEPPLAGLNPIPVKSTLMLINHFIVNTTTFLNHFMGICERKLNNVTHQIQRMEIVLALLEAKLNSVDYLEGNIGPSSTASTSTAATTGSSAPAAPGAPSAPGAPGEVPSAPSAPGAPGAPGAPAAPGAAPPADAAAAPAPAADGGVKLKDDPVYRQYLKLLGYGVPKSQVRQKLLALKLNPDVVDMDPEGPAPPHDGFEEAGALVSVSDGGAGESDNEDDNDHDDD